MNIPHHFFLHYLFNGLIWSPLKLEQMSSVQIYIRCYFVSRWHNHKLNDIPLLVYYISLNSINCFQSLTWNRLKNAQNSKALHNETQQKSSQITSTWKYTPYHDSDLKVLILDILRASASIVRTSPSVVWFIYMQTCIQVKVLPPEYLHMYFRMNGTYINYFSPSSNLRNRFFFPFPPKLW